MITFQRSATAVSTLLLGSLLAGCVVAPPRQPVYQQPVYQQQQPVYQQPGYPQGGYQQGGYQQGGYYEQAGTEYGRIANIEAMQVPVGSQTSGGGAVLGAVVGGLLGNQIGRGTGRAAATAAGVIGGAVAGNAIEGRTSQGYAQSYRITIQLDQGGMRAYDVQSPGDLRIGERVRLYNGQISRM